MGLTYEKNLSSIPSFRVWVRDEVSVMLDSMVKVSLRLWSELGLGQGLS